MPSFLRDFIFQRMKQKAGDLVAPVLNRSVGKLSSLDIPRKFTPTQPLRNFPSRMSPIQAPGLPSPPVKAVTRGVSPYVVGGTSVVGGGALGIGIAATDQIENTLNKVGPAIDRFFGQVTPQAIQNFGKEQESKGWRGALELATPLGFLAAPFIPSTPSSNNTRVSRPSGSLRDYGPRYKEKELATGAAAERFRPGAGFPGQQATSPQARADARERSRIAQLTEQDPLFKKYRVAELADAYNKAKGDERERIGLEIWAITNPSLAKEVPPGQVGYRTSAAMSGTQVFGSNMPGITQATYQQASEGANNIPYYGINAPDTSAYGLGANAQQIAFSPSGQPPVPMLGKDVFNKGFDIPSSEDLTQTQLALLKRAFEGRLK